MGDDSVLVMYKMFYYRLLHSSQIHRYDRCEICYVSNCL